MTDPTERAALRLYCREDENALSPPERDRITLALLDEAERLRRLGRDVANAYYVMPQNASRIQAAVNELQEAIGYDDE